LAGGLMGVFSPIVQIAVLTMFDARQDLSLRRAIAFELVRDDHARYVRHPLQQLAEKLLRCLLVSTALDENLQDVAILIDRPPQVVPFAADGQKHLIQVPLVARPGPAASELMGIRLSEFPAPLPDRLVGDDDSAGEQQLFNVSVAEAEAVVQPDAMADDLGRNPMVCVQVGWCRDVHGRSQNGLSV
jgi:hypothetical protein